MLRSPVGSVGGCGRTRKGQGPTEPGVWPIRGPYGVAKGARTWLLHCGGVGPSGDWRTWIPKSSRQSHNVLAARLPLFSVGRVVINDFATRALSPPTQCARSRVAPTGVADLGMGAAPVSTSGPDEQSGADGAGSGNLTRPRRGG